MSYSDSFPTQRPKLNLVFNGGSDQLDSRISFSRPDTPPTYAAPSAVHYWSNEKHLSSENLVPYSNLSSGFTFGQTTLVSTNNSAPDGGSDAASIVETAVSGKHEAYNTFAAVSGQQYSFVFYLKANGRTKVIFKPQATSVIAQVTFDLTAATSTVTSGSADSHSITAIGSTGWYKCVVVATATATGTGYTQINLADSGGSDTYLGEVNKGVFAWGASISTCGTVLSETSGSIHRSFAPTLKSVANAGDPRFEFDPITGSPRGLLVESQATNLITYSDNFGSWSALRVTAEAGASVGPDGQSCYVMREDSTAANTHYLSLGASGQSTSTTYTMSVYAKKVATSNQTRYLRLRVNGIGGQASVEYDLSNGTVNRTTGTSLDSSSISSIGNGWYRLVMTYTNPSDSVASGMIISGSPDTTNTLPSYDGDGYSAFALFGASVEQSSSVSSYIKSNSGSTVTRAADSCSVADFGFTGGPVSVYTEVTAAASADGTQRIFTLFENSDLVSTYFSGGGDIKTFVDVGGSTQVDASILANAVSGTDYKVGISFDTNDYRGVANGTLGAADTSCTLPDYSSPTLQIGAQSGGSNPLSGHIKRLSLFNVALSDVELQSLTSS